MTHHVALAVDTGMTNWNPMSAVCAAIFAIPTAYWSGDVTPMRLLAVWCAWYIGIAVVLGAAQAYREEAQQARDRLT